MEFSRDQNGWVRVFLIPKDQSDEETQDPELYFIGYLSRKKNVAIWTFRPCINGQMDSMGSPIARSEHIDEIELLASGREKSVIIRHYLEFLLNSRSRPFRTPAMRNISRMTEACPPPALYLDDRLPWASHSL